MGLSAMIESEYAAEKARRRKKILHVLGGGVLFGLAIAAGRASLAWQQERAARAAVLLQVTAGHSHEGDPSLHLDCPACGILVRDVCAAAISSWVRPEVIKGREPATVRSAGP